MRYYSKKGALMFNGKLQAHCDANNPQEAMLWALNAPIPEFNCDDVPVFDETMARMLSVHLWQCGFRYDPECQNRAQTVADDGSIIWTDNKDLEDVDTVKNIDSVVSAAVDQGQEDIVRSIAGKLNYLAEGILTALDSKQ